MANEELWKVRRGKELHSEEDVKLKIILPYLRTIGYTENDMRFENPIKVQVGSRQVTVYSDIEILIDGKPQIIIDTKEPTKTLSSKDVLQAVSYAKLVNTPAAMLGFATNGTDLEGMNAASGAQVYKIPNKKELIANIQKNAGQSYSEIELKEVRSTLLTILSVYDLYEVIKKCKVVIENEGLIRSDQSFKEMTKILLVKMNEERRAAVEKKPNRFSLNYLIESAKYNKTSELKVFKRLFKEATKRYKGIYRADDPGLLISSSNILIEIVKLIEPFSFLGTGDDIKGVVYETFLKANLRGDFDQYFTPRQIVDFMVKLAEPKYKEKFVDPAAGSGGFLVNAFNYVSWELKSNNLAAHDYEIAMKKLVEHCIWGQEADYDLHVLTKINMIMHGDGWNNIKQGDSLKTKYLPEKYFDIVLENPPFSTLYTDKNVLSNYELGHDRDSQELDLLFIEKSLRLLNNHGRMLIIIPEGLLNLPKYRYFREWLLSKTYINSVISLPAGAFQPFGRSASKTSIIEIRKRKGNSQPKYTFAATVNNIGYETGKSDYRETNINDFGWVLERSKTLFQHVEEIHGSRVSWIPYPEINSFRLDAGGLIGTNVSKNEERYVSLGELFDIVSPGKKLNNESRYYYVQVPYFSDYTGALEKYDEVLGKNIKGSSLNCINPGEIYLTRINPRKRRIGIVPTILEKPIYVSNEVYALKYKTNSYFDKSEQYAILPILRSKEITEKIMLMSTGSSSSRARVSIESILRLQIPVKLINKELSKGKSDVLLETANNILGSVINYQNLFR